MSIVIEIGDKEVSVNNNVDEGLRGKISDSLVSAWDTNVLIPWSQNEKEKHWVVKVKDLVCGINTKRRIHTLAVITDVISNEGYTLISSFSRSDGSHTLIFRK
eukprot:TRINITY_DN7619_c0_g2_i1.p1 TRINITY_DN7619_c0_g2~~TRINITY_DN7619_c0_g2_i1.p1  ORF type:complete len:113 (-),score=30.06 TRINITY_DN7619_c0_g2_i1:90-398(-)